MSRYEPVIGLEVHAQLLTRTKLFCRCALAFGDPPNSHVCPTCLALPGSLPVANAEAIRLAVRAALALNCTIHEQSVFARKQYFYPDLPKGYQISQYERPFSTDGYLEMEIDGQAKRAEIARVHLEEDAGKNVHGDRDSLVDLNRAGTPLIEIVGQPDLHTSAEAAQYLRALREILVFLGINDGNLEEGSFRCDANVSVRPTGARELGTRTELKNINSFRFVQRAIDVEIARQSAVLDSGGRVVQETRSYDPDTDRTATLRSKENAPDYRYFPDPDLPTLFIGPELIESERQHLNRLPAITRRRLVADGLTSAAAATLTQHPAYLDFFDRTRALFPEPVKVANWIQTEVLRGARVHGLQAEFPVAPEQVAELLGLVERGEISGKQAKEVYAAVEGTDTSPKSIVEQRGMKVLSDENALSAIVEEVVQGHPSQAAAYRAGKLNILGFFVGQVMQRTRGSADPKLVGRLLSERLSR